MTEPLEGQSTPLERGFVGRLSGYVASGLTLSAALSFGALPQCQAATGVQSQSRMSSDIAAGRPIVVHVIVALCDNENQGIVPVPVHLGNGKDPGSNLYWGAAYGLRTYLSGQAGWTRVPVEKPGTKSIRERLVLAKRITRGRDVASVYIVADAWDGAEMKSALEKFLSIAAGFDAEQVSLRNDPKPVTLSAGGASHLVAFVGHNGLMDVSVADTLENRTPVPANSSIVLACASKPFFLERLHKTGSHPLLLTTGLMAPESYTLSAAIETWIQGGSVSAVRDAAAGAYDKFQRCGLSAAKRLFWGQEP